MGGSNGNVILGIFYRYKGSLFDMRQTGLDLPVISDVLANHFERHAKNIINDRAIVV